MEYLVLDTETGGLLSNKHSLLSFALIRCTPHFQPIGDPLHLHCKHDSYVVDSGAMAVNKLDLRDAGSWLPKPTVIKALFEFLQLPEDYDNDEKYASSHPEFKLCGANIAFDIGFMKQYLGETLYARIFHYRGEEVTSVFRHLQVSGVVPPNAGLKLVQMAEALGIEADHEQLHGALYDAEVTRQVARELHKRTLVLKYAFDKMCEHYGVGPSKLIKCFDKPGHEKRLAKLLEPAKKLLSKRKK